MQPGRIERVRAWCDRVLIAVFLLVLAAPTIDTVLRPVAARGPLLTEKREAAWRPWLPTSLEELARYPRQFEDWYLDSFGLRDKFLRWDSWIKLFVFGQSPTPTVDIGREGWMWYTAERSVAVHRGLAPFDEAWLDDWVAMLRNRQEVCAAGGMAQLFVLGPNKESVYPEYLPPWWTKLGPSRLDQLQQRLDQVDPGGKLMLNLRPAMLAAKVDDVPGDYLYFQYGTHWNGRGCYLAYREILAALQARFPAVAPLPPGAFRVVDAIGHHGDSWGSSMYLDDLLPQRWIAFCGAATSPTHEQDHGKDLTVFTGGNPAGPRVVMIHDSFGESIMHLLAPHFSRLVCYGEATWSEELIARERPDLVLAVFVERLLVQYWPGRNMMSTSQLGRAFFAQAKERMFELTAVNAASVIVPLGAARITAAAGDLVTLHMGDADAHVRLMPFADEVVGDLSLHLEVDSTVATRLRVLAVCEGPGLPDAWAQVTVGRNELWLRLPYRRAISHLELHPGHAGEYTLRALEVRQVPR